MIETVYSRSVAKAFQSTDYQATVKGPVQKWKADPQIAMNMATCTINLPPFMLPVVKFVKQKVENDPPRNLEWTNTDMPQIWQHWAKTQRSKTNSCHRRWTQLDPHFSLPIYPTLRRRMQSHTVPLRQRISWISPVMIVVAKREGARTIVSANTITLRHPWGTGKIIPRPASNVLHL